MTEEYIKVDPVAWKQALKKFKAVQVDFKAIKDDDDVDEAVETLLRYGDAESALLNLDAPDVEGVIEKLLILFGDDLWADTEEALQMCRVIGNLRGIQRVNNV